MKNILTVVLGILSLSLASCSSDDDNNYPVVTPEHMVGDYNGKMDINGELVSDIAVNINENLTVSQLPLKPIIEQLVAEEDLDAILESVTPVSYVTGYNAVVQGHKIGLILEAPELLFNIVVGEVTKEVKVTFDTNNTGLFDGSDNTLAFQLKAINATLGSEEAEGNFEPVVYRYLPARKIVVEVTPKEVEGTYEGKLNVAQGDAAPVENEVSVLAKEGELTIDKLPMKEIALALVDGDEEQATTLVDNWGEISYKLAYEAAVTAEKNKVELTFTPETLTVKMVVEEVEQDVVITFSVADKGVYTVEGEALTFSFTADKITVAEEEVAEFTPISYTFPEAVKK